MPLTGDRDDHHIRAPAHWAGEQRISAIARTAAKVAMRDSAESVVSAMAIEIQQTAGYHALIERDRRRIRQEERQRLARDLHHSVIHHVFATSMYARTLNSVLARA